MLFGNSPGATAHKIALLGINTETACVVEKAQILANEENPTIAFLLNLDMRQYGELIL